MNRLHTKGIAVLAVAGAIFFSSCSRQMAQISTTSKLAIAQSVKTDKLASRNSVAETPVAINDSRQYCDEAPVLNNQIKPELSKKTAMDRRAVIRKAKMNRLIENAPQKLVNTLSHQSALFSRIAENHHLASYTSPNRPQGFLGIAGICLIIALALAVLGFTQKGTVFWQLSAILIIAAVVFLLIYLIQKAASPKTD